MQSAQPISSVGKDTSDILHGLADVLEKARIQGGVSGMSVVVVHKGETIFAKGFGKRNETEPFTPETLVPIASCTKAFSSAAIGELVAEGKMDWDKTPVNKYLPEFELKDPVLTAELTMDDLLSHRTGLSSPDIPWLHSKEPRRELIKKLRHLDLPTRIRTKWVYNNILYAVAGEAAANVAGMSYEELVVSKVLRPLGMTRSGFSPMEMRTKTNFALPHTAASFEEAQKGNFTVLPLDEIYMADAPAGDMYSSGLEMAIWAKAIMNDGKVGEEQILNKESIKTIKRPHVLRSRREDKDFGISAYGLGWGLETYRGHSLVQHSGSVVGFRSHIATFPDDDLAIVFLTNTDVTELCTLAQYYIADTIFGLPPTQDWLFEMTRIDTQESYQSYKDEATGEFPEQMEGKPPAHNLDAYTGEYDHVLHGRLTVREVGGVLELQMRELRGELKHLHFESFTTLLKDLGILIAAQFDFKTGPEGKVAGLTMYMDGEEVVFARM